jgi:hypothetical protein
MNLELDEIIYREGSDRKGRKLPKWARRIYVNKQRDEVYLPVEAYSMSSSEALLCLSFDGVVCAIDGVHVYAPSGWISSEKPVFTPEISEIKTKILDQVRDLYP